MKKNNLKRFLASLLAVLMLSQVTGVSPAVFADWGSNVSLTAAKATDKRLELNGDKEIRIPYKDNGDIDFDALYPLIFETCVDKSKSALQSYDKSKIDIEQQQKACHKLEGDFTCEPIKEDQTYTIKFTYHYGSLLWDKTEKSCKITFLGREALPDVSAITADTRFNDDLSINYDALRQDIFDQVKAQVNLPENVKFENVSYKYYFTYDYKIGIYKEWVAFEGKKGVNIGNIHINIPAIACGSTYKVQLSWGGDDTYKAWSPEFDVTVVDGRTDTSISFVEDRTVNIPFTETGIDYEAVKESIWALVDTITPAGISKDSITVKYEGTDINDNPAISEGNHTLNFSYAGSANYKPFSTDVPVNFIDNRIVAFAAKERPDNLSRGYVGNTLDEAKTLEKAREELVTALKDVPLSEIKVEYKLAGNYIPLDINGIRLNLTDINKTDIRVSYAGNATYKAFSAEFKDLYFADNRVASSIVLKENSSITYNKEKGAMKQDIFDNAIDWEATKLPEGITKDDLTFECNTSLVPKITVWGDIDGKEYPNLDAGDAQKIRISFVGNSDFKPGEFEFTIKVAKAHVDVSMKKFATAYAGDEEALSKEALNVALDPNDDPRIDIYMVFAGINTNFDGSVNLVLTDDQWKVIKNISAAEKEIYNAVGQIFPEYKDRPTLQEKLEDGITIGEFKQYISDLVTVLEKVASFPGVDDIFKHYNIDIDSIRAMVNIFEAIDFADDTTIAFGVPKHAGLYRAYAIAVNKNYEPNYATGTVLILMNWKGIKIVPNADLKKQTITVSEAKEYADGTKAAATLLNKSTGESSGIDQSALHYRFTGLNKIYSSHDFPTAPGKYIVTVSVRGGDYYALPTTFTFTVKAD